MHVRILTKRALKPSCALLRPDLGDRASTKPGGDPYFFSNRQHPHTADLDAYVATRRTRDDAFGAAAPILPVNTDSDERGGSVSSDGLNLFFHSSRINGYDLYVSTRPNTAASFGMPVNLGAGVNTTDLDQEPFISSDSQTLYFTRTPAAGGNSAIYRAVTSPTGFGNAAAVAELDTALAARPVLSADGLTIFFASDRPGGAGNLDIWVASRTSPTGTFGQITNVTSLNASDFEFPDWLSQDGCRIYLGADPLHRRKVDRFREVGFGVAIRIDRERVASAA